MHSLGRVAFGIFLSAGGLFAFAGLESTPFFWFPFGVDAAVMVMTIRHPGSRWMYPVLATAGSVAGTALTFWMGRKAGEAGLERYVPKKHLKSAKAAVKEKGAVTAALFGIIPPPFPFTAFVVAAGAMAVDPWSFLGVLALVRLARFGGEAILANHYGSSVLAWINSPIVQDVVAGIIFIAFIGSGISLYVLLKKRPRTHGKKSA